MSSHPALAVPSQEPIRPRTLLALAGLALLLLLPFLSKPLHVDDPLFVWTARQIVAHPTDPWGFTVDWGGHARPMSEEMENPPLVPYFLAVVGRVVGWREVGLHAAFLPVGVATVVGAALLAARFCRHPVAAALLLAVAPGFWVSATSLMADGPLLCLWVWSVYLWIRASEAGATGRAIALLAGAAGTMLLAVLTKYPAVSLIPLLAAHAILCPAPRRGTRVAQAIALAVPALALVAYDRLTAIRYGHGLVWGAVAFSRSTTHQNPVPVAGRLADAFCYVAGAALPAAIVGASVVARSWVGRIAAVVVALGGAGLAAHLFAPPSGWARHEGPPAWAYFAQFGLLAMLGVAALVGAVVGGRDRRGAFLLLWVGGVVAFATFVNWSINVRTMLPLVPAVCILAVRAIERLALPVRRTVAAALAVGGTVALAVVWAEFRYAADNRDAAALLSSAWTAKGIDPSRVWFGGHWGFQYYMQLAGARPLDDHDHAYRDGDTVILALDNAGTPAVDGQLERVAFVPVGTGSWLTTMNLSMGGGFHASPGYRLPFVFGPMPPEAYEVTRLHR